MVERRLAKAKVAGSNPVFRSRRKQTMQKVCFRAFSFDLPNLLCIYHCVIIYLRKELSSFKDEEEHIWVRNWRK